MQSKFTRIRSSFLGVIRARHPEAHHAHLGRTVKVRQVKARQRQTALLQNQQAEKQRQAYRCYAVLPAT